MRRETESGPLIDIAIEDARIRNRADILHLEDRQDRFTLEYRCGWTQHAAVEAGTIATGRDQLYRLAIASRLRGESGGNQRVRKRNDVRVRANENERTYERASVKPERSR